MNTSNMDARSVVDLYRAFRDLASRIEKITRPYDPGFYWLRKDTLKAAESVCAILRDASLSAQDREIMMLLYQCRHEVRETLRHLQYAGDARLLNPPDDRIVAPYREASRALENVIAEREERMPSLWEAPLSPRENEPASHFNGQTQGVRL